MRFDRLQAFWPLLAIGGLFLLQWLLLFSPNPGVWDGAFYYAYARSPIFDLDLHLANDLILAHPYSTPDFVDKHMERDLVADTGRVASPFALGSSLLWIPWLTIARLATFSQEVTGYEWWFVGPTAVFSSLLSLIAFGLAYKLTRAETDNVSALFATLTSMVATPLLYYQFREPFYAHSTTAFINTVCIYVWWKEWEQRGRWPQAVKLGLLLGFAALVRWQYLIFLLLPASSALIWWWQSPTRKTAVWPIVKHLFIVGLSVVVVLSPQLAFWQLFYGSWITVPQGATFVDWSAPYIFSTLFSPFRGLIPWMPLILPAVIGLLLLMQKRPRLAAPLLGLLLVGIYVNGSIVDWFAGGGYGPRRFTGEVAIFVLGYAALLAALAPRTRWVVGVLGMFILMTHQLVLLRYALVEKLGGRVVTMAPTFEWAEVSWSEFLTSLWVRLPTAVSAPSDFFIYPDTLSAALASEQFPWLHLTSLLLGILYLALLIRGWRWLRSRTTTLQLLVTLGVMWLLIDLWILLAA